MTVRKISWREKLPELRPLNKLFKNLMTLQEIEDFEKYINIKIAELVRIIILDWFARGCEWAFWPSRDKKIDSWLIDFFIFI